MTIKHNLELLKYELHTAKKGKLSVAYEKTHNLVNIHMGNCRGHTTTPVDLIGQPDNQGKKSAFPR